jgi:hypothetical protein
LSTQNEDHKENQDALEVVRRLADALEKNFPQVEETPSPPIPTTADEFCEVLERLNEAGVRFDENGILMSSEAKSPPGGEESASDVISAMARRFPFVPREVRHLLNVLLVGEISDPEIVGEPDEASRKSEALQRFVITPELEDRYFVRRVSKAPVLTDMDWGVGIKTAERGWRGRRGIPFAEVAFTLTNYNLPEEDQSRVVHACVHEAMLVSVMENLSQSAGGAARGQAYGGSRPAES